MIAILASIWPYLASGTVALAGVVFGMFRSQQAKAATAQADAAKAQAGQQVADQQVAETQANADAQKAGSDAAAARTDIDNAVAAKPADEVRNDLQNWTRS
jgi:uncharacterized protein YpuA (DUF1002 family)